MRLRYGSSVHRFRPLSAGGVSAKEWRRRGVRFSPLNNRAGQRGDFLGFIIGETGSNLRLDAIVCREFCTQKKVLKELMMKLQKQIRIPRFQTIWIFGGAISLHNGATCAEECRNFQRPDFGQCDFVKKLT